MSVPQVTTSQPPRHVSSAVNAILNAFLAQPPQQIVRLVTLTLSSTRLHAHAHAVLELTYFLSLHICALNAMIPALLARLRVQTAQVASNSPHL